jgi:hypothetical protein
MQNAFSFNLSDLDYWLIKRKDGEMVKYVVSKQVAQKQGIGWPNLHSSHQAGYIRACNHNGSKVIFETPTVRLYIADAAGCRAAKDSYDFVIDCGDLLNVDTAEPEADALSGVLEGDYALVDLLDQYAEPPLPPARILQIDWDDRQAPPLQPEFWPELANTLVGDTLCACVGGHGRSGTSLTALMMCLNPEYSARDAIVHLRAVHCPRAIESNAQHAYLDKVAEVLGRTQNATEVHEIKSFKEAFFAMPHDSAKPFQRVLQGLPAQVS